MQGLPGIGPRKAELLLQQFGGVGRIFSAPAAELKQVSGIGDKIAHEIRWILEPDERIRINDEVFG